MRASVACEALTSVSWPTAQSVSIVFGPMVQFSPMTVFPRRIVPGRITVPAPSFTRGSM